MRSFPLLFFFITRISQICAKGEGELCGGEQYSEGECGDKLQCMVRHIKDNRNLDKKNVGELVGRCEYSKYFVWMIQEAHFTSMYRRI